MPQLRIQRKCGGEGACDRCSKKKVQRHARGESRRDRIPEEVNRTVASSDGLTHVVQQRNGEGLQAERGTGPELSYVRTHFRENMLNVNQQAPL